MDASLPDENAQLRALLQEQQTTIRKMAEYNRLLSQRVEAYASEINRLKALVDKLQRMQFGKSSEKLREKTARQVRDAEERISALQEEMAEMLGEQHDPVLPQPLRQSSARKKLPATLPRETRTLPPTETACPACGGELSTLGRWSGAVSELLEPLYDLLRQYVLMPGKVHTDDIPVPVQEPGSGKTRTARLWVYVRDDRNAGSLLPPAVWSAYSPDRKGGIRNGTLQDTAGILQADAYGGYNALYEDGRIAACMAHARRKIHDVYIERAFHIAGLISFTNRPSHSTVSPFQRCDTKNRLSLARSRS